MSGPSGDERSKSARRQTEVLGEAVLPSGPTVVQAVTGIGGIGKTTAAIEYAPAQCPAPSLAGASQSSGFLQEIRCGHGVAGRL